MKKVMKTIVAITTVLSLVGCGLGETLDIAPSDITLSSSSIMENNAVDAEIGTIVVTDDNDEDCTLTLGGDDASSFSIVDGVLKANEAFDYETKSEYSIKIAATDSADNIYEQALTVTVENEREDGEDNTPPTVTLSNNTVTDNQIYVGEITATDDFTTSENITISISGGTDADLFTLESNKLYFNTHPDATVKDTFSITISADDGESADNVSTTDLTITATDSGLPTFMAYWPMDGDLLKEATGTYTLTYSSSEEGTLPATHIPADNTNSGYAQFDQDPVAGLLRPEMGVDAGTSYDFNKFGSDAFSVAFWINVTSTSGYEAVLDFSESSDYEGYRIMLKNDDIRFRAYTGSSQTNVDSPSGDTICDGEWHHVVATYNDSSIVLYVDGSSVNTATATIAENTRASEVVADGADGEMFCIGGISGTSASSNRAGVKMDEVYFFESALTAGEVTTLYNLGH